jgi:ornithine cyclodeaminase
VQARAHAEALLLTHPFERVLVAGRAAAPEFANWVQTELGVEAAAVDASTAAHEADVICTATRSTEPLFDGALVRPGAFVVAVGSSKPAARELDDTLLARADLIVVEWLAAAQAEAGEFARAAPGTIDPARVTELGKLLVKGRSFERRPHDIIVYKSVGIGLEDVALANLVWQKIN